MTKQLESLQELPSGMSDDSNNTQDIGNIATMKDLIEALEINQKGSQRASNLVTINGI